MWFTCCTHSFKMLISCRIKTTLYEFTYENPFKYILNKNFKWNHAVKTCKIEPSFVYICQNVETKKGVERNNENILRVVWKAIKNLPFYTYEISDVCFPSTFHEILSEHVLIYRYISTLVLTITIWNCWISYRWQFFKCT